MRACLCENACVCCVCMRAYVSWACVCVHVWVRIGHVCVCASAIVGLLFVFAHVYVYAVRFVRGLVYVRVSQQQPQDGAHTSL